METVRNFVSQHYGVVLGVVFDMENQKNYARAQESAGTSEKSDQKLGSKTMITFFDWFQHFSELVNSFFRFSRSKTTPNHSIPVVL